MRFHLTDEDITFLKEHSIESYDIIRDMRRITNGEFEFYIDDYDMFIVNLTDAVLCDGMDDEDTVNDIGKRLYSITDKLVAQKHLQSE